MLVAPAVGRLDGSLLPLVVVATSALLVGAVDPVSRVAAVLESVAVLGAVDELMRLRSLVEEDASVVLVDVEGVLLAIPLVLDVSEPRVLVPAAIDEPRGVRALSDFARSVRQRSPAPHVARTSRARPRAATSNVELAPRLVFFGGKGGVGKTKGSPLAESCPPTSVSPRITAAAFNTACTGFR